MRFTCSHCNVEAKTTITDLEGTPHDNCPDKFGRWVKLSGPHGGARFHPPGRKYGRPPKAVKVKHLRSAIAEPESPEELQAIEWWKGLSPKERLRMIVNMEESK